MLFTGGSIKDVVSAGLLASLIVGAGIFALPHVFARAGLIYSLVALIFFAWASYSINTRYAQIIDRNGDNQRFAGYAKNYFNTTGHLLSLIVVLGGIIFALTVYIALAPAFFSLIFPTLPGVISVLIFWAVATVITFAGVKIASTAGIIVFVMMVAIIIIFGAMALAGGHMENIFGISLFNPVNILLPFGPLLFAFSGRAAISSIRARYAKTEYEPKNFRKIILIGVLIPAVIYIIFVIATIALSGGGVTPDAVTGLTVIPVWGLIAIGILGLSAILTSHILLGMEFIGIVSKDIKLSNIVAYALFAIVPIIIYFFGSDNFLTLIGITGGIFLAAESIMVVLMGRSAFGPRRADIFLVAVFVLGIIYEISWLLY